MAIKKGDKVQFSSDVKVLQSINREGKPQFISDAVAAKIAGKEGVVLDTNDLMLYGEKIATEVTVELDKSIGVAPLKLTDKHFRKMSKLVKAPRVAGKWGNMSVLLNLRRDTRVILSNGVKAIQKTETPANVVIDDSITQVEKLLAEAKKLSADIKAGTFKAPKAPPVKNPKPKKEKPAPAKK
jgi:hypothetical protein